ncbi:lipopolysaccharide heptosyltransferase I [Thiothrix subterranea]|uniref:lipopolysaccharide heptosyltransferase I n=1 Tax=Thiothrix subterranea TaxID=2735563 RepID=UPI00192C6ABB|nr:lipopolysaccharide heptosyltransferase I [Thiothrix subterranea]QQZ28093.1 lipopolysaccharide heptosyltransferase I [Thiothrix subterranea]
MKILIVKTSSLGDVVHMLPAISDAHARIPNLSVDWVVEENFAEVPAWHAGVSRVIPVALRRWRKHLFSAATHAEMQTWRNNLQQSTYDVVLDSQGLVKSAVLGCFAQGTRHGYDRHSSREPLASIGYQRHHAIARDQHAITRNRLLTAAALGYTLEGLPLHYGISQHAFGAIPAPLPQPYIVALHGTSRPAKEWAESHWQKLIQAMAARGIHTLLPWGNTREHERATRLAQHPHAHCLPRCRLGELAAILQGAQGVIGMDTGLMHLAAALDKPSIALYPVTAPALTGLLGNDSNHYQPLSVSGDETQDSTKVIATFLAQLTDQRS